MIELDNKLTRLSKRYKGLARVAASINDLYIYGIYESNFPNLMKTLDLAKDHVKSEIQKTKDEIEMISGFEIQNPKNTLDNIYAVQGNEDYIDNED